MAPIALEICLPYSPSGEKARPLVSTLPIDSAGCIVTPSATPSTIDELMRLRAHEQPNQPILAYPLNDADYVEYSYRELDVFSARVASHYAKLIPTRRSSNEKEKVVALLGPSNLDYLITVLALTKLGFTVLFLSTRLSDAAYLSLLESTQCSDIVIHPTFSKAVRSLQDVQPLLGVHSVAEFSLYGGGILEGNYNTRFDFALDLQSESNKICWIIHSSGSTGLPKPIYQTHSAALRNYKNNLNMKGFITLPLFHAHGISSVFRAFDSAKKIYMYSANLPLTHNNLLNIMANHDFEIFYGVPYALKLLGETQEGINALVRMKVVMFGGSACPDSLGDRLVEQGVNLISHYGTTETGQLMTSFRDRSDKSWNYLRPSADLIPFLRMEPRGVDLFELVVLDGWPSKVATNRPDGAYATKDLFTPHPTIPNAWRYSARLDDTIALLNGEKANPTDIEQLVRDNKNVREAVVFGNGKPQLGMMIVPAEQTTGLYESQIFDLIWPTIVAANAISPGYAQLSAEMVKLLPADTVYPRTDKGTVIRQAFYKMFEKEIEDVCIGSESTASSNPPGSESEIRSFLRASFLGMMGNIDLSDDTDFFSIGLDSLQALRLRSLVLKQLPISNKDLGMNVVFDFPSINALTKELLSLQDGVKSQSVPAEVQMAEIISRYGQFPQHTPKQNSNEGQYIVMTGATGSLGAHLIAKLAVLPHIKKIQCLVRSRTVSDAKSRVVESLRIRQIYHQLPLEARRKVIALPSDLSMPDLGLGSEVYSEISRNITCLIHCAWSVNFNLSLQSFEKDCIAGARNLMLLCLAAERPQPASFNFCSSVSAVAATPADAPVPEDLPVSLKYAQNMGYAQSKLVTENLVHQAALQTGMQARTLRVGQIVADTEQGVWNATEAIPLMLQAAKTIGAIPALNESPLWLPVDIVAAAVAEISLSDAPAGTTNIVASKSFHWTRDLLPKLHAAGLAFEKVGQREWIRRLRNSNPDAVRNPPFKLLEFFAKKYDNDNTVRKGLQYDTQRARELSPALARADVLNQTLVDKFVAKFLTTSWRTPEEEELKTKGTIVVVAGPCGSGKSTVGSAVARQLQCPFVEGDAHHDEASLAKMSAGTALNDDDRWAWLARLRSVAEGELQRANSAAVVVSCSALKKTYRDILRRGDESVSTVFVMLQVGDKDVLAARMEQRPGHYMKPAMVEEQVRILELPAMDEIDVYPVDASSSPAELVSEVARVI